MKKKQLFDIPDRSAFDALLATQQKMLDSALRQMERIGKQWSEQTRQYKDGDWVTIQTKAYTTAGNADGRRSIVLVPAKFRQAEVYGVKYDRFKDKIVYKLRPIDAKGKVRTSLDDYINPLFDTIVAARPKGDFCPEFYKGREDIIYEDEDVL